MKDIYKILKDQDIEVEDKEKFEKDFFGNYKSVAEFEKKTEEISELKNKSKRVEKTRNFFRKLKKSWAK